MSIITKLTIAVLIGLEHWSLATRDPVIGPYKQLNPNGCGLSRLSADRTKDCYRWHDSLNSLSAIIGGRNVSAGEAPWVVLVNKWHMTPLGVWAVHKGTCTGSIIADQWVLTAAHCVNDTRVPPLEDPHSPSDHHWNVTVVSGYNVTVNAVRDVFRLNPNDWNKTYVQDQYHIYKAVEIHIHDNYTDNRKRAFNDTFNVTFGYHDIALLKLDRPIQSVSNPTDPTLLYENSICLPTESYDYITGDSIGVIAGHSRVLSSGDLPFQLGYRRINAGLQSTLVMETHVMDDIVVCKGDSGGPIWRYTSGRAVIVGIGSHGLEPLGWDCNQGIGMYMRVERYVDWIMALTGLDKRHLDETGHSMEFVDINNELENMDLGQCEKPPNCNN